jgi:hypothetical protein
VVALAAIDVVETVAGRISETPSDVSRFLRHTEGKSFTSFLNEHRIEYCLTELRRAGPNKSVLEVVFA